jgi:hypothetical protein
MKTHFVLVLMLLSILFVSGCGIWTHYTPIASDDSYKWYRETSTLYLQNDSTLTVIANLPDFVRDKDVESTEYSLSISSPKNAEVAVNEIFVQAWNDKNQELITPKHFEISTLKGDFPNATMTEVPDSLKVLKKGQHRIAFYASLPRSSIDKTKRLNMHFYIRASVNNQEVIIDRTIRFYKTNEPLVLLSV